MSQLDLLEDTHSSERETDAGMSRALRAERVQLWKAQAELWLTSQEAGTEFVADDIVRAIGLPDSGVAKNNVVGAWISSKSRAGSIVFAGRLRKSKRVVRHGNLLRVWIVA